MREKTITRICRLCNQPFTIVTAQKKGRYVVRVNGWQNKRFCTNCIPQALYQDHAAYQRFWWHNRRKVADES